MGLTQLVAFLCFSILPCVQVLPGVYFSVKEAVQEAIKESADACVAAAAARLRAKGVKPFNIDYEPLWVKCGAPSVPDDFNGDYYGNEYANDYYNYGSEQCVAEYTVFPPNSDPGVAIFRPPPLSRGDRSVAMAKFQGGTRFWGGGDF